jgi:hypothetical protein
MVKVVLPKPVKIIRKKVSPEEVGKYYLKAEFHKLFPFSKPSALEEMEGFIDCLEGKTFWRVLEAMSFAYRINSVFRFVSGTARTWSEEEYNISDLKLTDMNPKIDKIIFSPEINQDPLKFRSYLLKYFENHPGNDPEGLDNFRPKDRKMIYPKILLRREEKGLLIFDGMNRLVASLLRGEKTIVAFVGRKTNTKGKPMVGDSVFCLLRRLHHNARGEEKEAVLETVRQLISASRDGCDAVENYWVKHVRDEEEKEIGKKLLRR